MNFEDRERQFESREDHIAYLHRRLADFVKPEKEPEPEDPWTEDAVRIVGEKLIEKLLAREKGAKHE